ncbi:hypothetical protein SEPCBS57363_003162 [Sporothrix epigloea]|uniref:C2H2-type domain-containing protein n=1 Tax=Sporothrix epigloea TaxID=1892477 RepID=A0ABP0DLQ4_9PEZI
MQAFPTEPSTSDNRDAEIGAAMDRHNFETFAKHLQDAAMYIYHQGQRMPYAKVSALLLMWEEDTSVTADLTALERTLCDRYNFHTERWGIPAVADPGALLSSRISKFVDHSNADHLSIIYYVGNGRISLDNQLYWSCTSRDDTPKVNWSVVRSAIDNAYSDVLFLLDSCVPGHMPVSGSNGAKQVIAAYTSDDGPQELGKRSFTSFLVESFQNLGTGRPFNTQHLYDDIISNQQIYERRYPSKVDYNAFGQSTPAVSHAPLFFSLTPTGTTIDLAPMPKSQNFLPKFQNGSRSALSRPASDDIDQFRDVPVISPAAVAEAVFDEPRLLVCTTFVGDSGPDMASFKEWIANTPSLASKVAVEGMFLGPPTVLLISVPQSLWVVIQDAKICFSLGYINSHNLVNLYDGLIKTAPKTPPSVPAPSSIPNISARDIEDGQTLLEARNAAVNNSPPYRDEYHPLPYYLQQQQPPALLPMATLQPQQLHPHQHQHQYSQAPPQHYSSVQHQPVLPPPALSQLLLPPSSAIHTHQPLPLPVPQRQNSHSLPSAMFHESGAAGHFESSEGIRQESIPQLQEHPVQKFTASPHVISLPRIVSRSGSPILAKHEREDSEEVKEAAEQLKALSHVRPANSDSPPSFTAGSHLSEIAQSVIKCQADDSTSEDLDIKRGDDALSPTKKIKSKKEYRFTTAKLQDGQPVRSRSKSDLSSQPFTSLQSQNLKPELQCDRCQELFKDHSSLRKHVASAHTRPFPCTFSFAGCSSTFGSKNEWKRHIASQHLCLQYYRCSDCSQGSVDGKGNEFNRKDLFTQHLRRMHAPVDVRKAIQKGNPKVETQWEEYVKEMQKTCCIVRRLPPQRSACPRPECDRLFEGRSAWDEWTEHVGRHMENGEGDFLGVDNLLISWALNEGIISLAEDGSFSLCNPIGSGSSGGGNSNNNSSNNHGSNSITNGNTDDQGSGSHPNSNGRFPTENLGKKSLSPHTRLKLSPTDAHDPMFSQQGEKTAIINTPSPIDTVLPHTVDVIEPHSGAAEQATVLANKFQTTEVDPKEVSSDAANAYTAVPADAIKITTHTGDLIDENNATVENIFKVLPDGTETDMKPSKPAQLSPFKTDDLSGLQSITIAAIAAAASLQEQEIKKATDGAVGVDT